MCIERRPEIWSRCTPNTSTGSVPNNLPKVQLDRDRRGQRDDRPYARDRQRSHRPGRQLNLSRQSACSIHTTLITPAHANGPVPVLMMFGRAGFPAPHEFSADETRPGSTHAWKAQLVGQDPSLKDVFAQHPAWQPVKATPFQFPQLNEDGDLPNTWQLIAAGWGFALLDPASVQADDGAGITRGIIGLVNNGQPRSPEDRGRIARMGLGRRPWTGLSRIRSRRRCKACRHRRRFALWQGSSCDDGLRSAI